MTQLVHAISDHEVFLALEPEECLLRPKPHDHTDRNASQKKRAHQYSNASTASNRVWTRLSGADYNSSDFTHQAVQGLFSLQSSRGCRRVR
jgi:hypothetical protein